MRSMPPTLTRFGAKAKRWLVNRFDMARRTPLQRFSNATNSLSYTLHDIVLMLDLELE
jgi:hypothetical protein